MSDGFSKKNDVPNRRDIGRFAMTVDRHVQTSPKSKTVEDCSFLVKIVITYLDNSNSRFY